MKFLYLWHKIVFTNFISHYETIKSKTFKQGPIKNKQKINETNKQKHPHSVYLGRKDEKISF